MSKLKAKLKTLKDSVHYTVAMLGQKRSIPVVCDPNAPTAYTDFKRVYYPPLPENDEEAIHYLRGMTDHEAFHLRFSDQTLGFASQIEKHVHMAFEDVRIELSGGRKYPGSITNIDRMIDLMVAKKVGYFGRPESDKEHPGKVVGGYVLTTARAHVRKTQSLEPIAEAWRHQMEKIVPGLHVRLDTLIFKIPECQTEAEALQLARLVLKTVQDYVKEMENPPQQQPGGGDPDQNSGQGQQGSGAGNSGDADDSQSGDGKSQDGADQGGDAGGNDVDGDEAKGPDAAQGDGDANSADDSASGKGAGSDGGVAKKKGRGGANQRKRKRAAKNAQKALDMKEGDAESTDLVQQASDAIQDKVEQAKSAENVIPSQEAVEAHPPQPVDPDEALRVSIRLRASLVNLVEATKRNRIEHVERGSRIDSNVLYRVGLKDARIFVRRDERRAPNTAVHVTVDISGSMHQGKAETAMSSALAIAHALEMIPGVAREVTAFPWIGNHQVLPVVRYDQPVSAARHRFSAMANGGTPMAEALFYSALRLAQRTEQRKVAIVVTDGQPDDPSAVKNLVERMVNEGMMVYGIGISTMSVETLFPHHAVINSVSELAQALSDILRADLSAAA